MLAQMPAVKGSRPDNSYRQRVFIIVPQGYRLTPRERPPRHWRGPARAKLLPGCNTRVAELLERGSAATIAAPF
jgi:hypothetical protein